MKVRSHTVAKAAYERVAAQHRGELRVGNVEEYRTLANKLPAMILQNGLSQATGFLIAKGKHEHRTLLADLCTVLQAPGTTDASSGQALHGEIIESDLDRTLILTRRALEASGWLKRYAQGLLGRQDQR